MKYRVSLLFLLGFLLFVSSSIFCEEPAYSGLTTDKEVQIYYESTSRIRCICIPSVPIKDCTFNNCTVSAHLKEFIANRIKAGDSADTIVNHMVNGFGESALEDPIVKKFINDGNTGMANAVVYGFGPDILANPDSTWINLSLLGAGIFGLAIIIVYLKRRKGQNSNERTETEDNLANAKKKYLDEVEKRQK